MLPYDFSCHLLLSKIMPFLTVSGLEYTFVVQAGLLFHCEVCVSPISQLNEETQTGPFQVTSFSNQEEAPLVCRIYK